MLEGRLKHNHETHSGSFCKEINPQLAEEGSAGAQQTVEVGRSLIRAALGESVLIRRGL